MTGNTVTTRENREFVIMLPFLHSPHATTGLAMGAEETQTDNLAALYRLAFERFGTVALLNNRPVNNPGPRDALAITHSLRTHGGMNGRRLAERIETLCRAAD